MEPLKRDELLSLLRKLEHCYPDETYGEDPSPSLCPKCEHDGSGHYEGCKLAAAIAWLEDENNATDMYTPFGKPMLKKWVLR